MSQNLIKEMLQEGLAALSLEVPSYVIEHPADVSFGDVATNAAIVGGKISGMNPKELAIRLVEKMRENLPEEIARIEVAGPGFINFFFSRKFFAESVSEILKCDESWGRNETRKGMKVMVEYTDPNPFKEFHIGHLMSNAIGESISRLIEFSGADVRRANYQGDVGMHVAKALWGIRRLAEEGVRDAATWGRAYALGARAYEEEAGAKEEIREINQKIYRRSDVALNKLYDEGRAVSLAHFEELYKKLGTVFHFYFFETESAPIGVETVKRNIGSVFEESEGAVVFRGAKAGLHTRVFINSQGLPTYEAKELGLAKLKQERWPHDLSVVVTANEVNEYFRVLLAALGELAPDIAKKIRHVDHGFLRLPSGKMSSRTGSVVTGESLLRELENAVREKISGRDMENDEREKIEEAVSVAAVKYAILRQSAGKDIIFEKESALSFEGDSGPYLQYAHVRACSILSRAKEAKVEWSADGAKPEAVSGVEKLLYRFPEVVLRSAKEYDPHYLATYLIELSGEFNAYYAKEKIVDMSPEMPYKIALTKAFQITMRNGLSLLGIRAPERM